MHLFSTKRLLLIAIVACLLPTSFAWGQFDFNFNIDPSLPGPTGGASPGNITAAQQAALNEALDESAAFWQQFIVGFQPSVSNSLTGIDINVGLSNFADADGNPNGPGNILATGGFDDNVFESGGFTFITTAPVNPTRLSGQVTIDSADFDNLDSLLFFNTLNHEIAHILGFGTLFVENGLLVNGTGQFTGAQGVATFRDEFDPDATFIPIELDGGPGTADAHLNETISFGSLENLIANPDTSEGAPAFIPDPDGEDDPGDLDSDPELTVLLAGDTSGLSLNDDLLTGRLSSDGSVFLSDTTVAIFQDIGFEVVLPSTLASTAIPEPSSLLLLGGLTCLTATRRRRS